MIDERYLADARRCPSCTAVLPEPRTACPACGLRLEGDLAGRLWKASVEASALLTQRSRLIAELRGTAPAAAPSQAVPSAGRPAGSAAPRPSGPLTPPVVRPEWTPRRVQNLLLVLGAGLLGVAAVIFVAVSWGRLGVGGRAAVMTGLTVVAAWAGLSTWRRGLTATAEALSLLAVGLALLDCAGAWASDLLGLRDVDGLVVAAGSAALVAMVAGAGSTVLRTRALRLSAVVLAQLPVPLLLAHAVDRVDNPAALVGAGLGAQAFAVAVLVAGLVMPHRPIARDVRLALLGGGMVAAVSATLSALVAAYLEDDSVLVGSALLVVFAAGVGVAAELVERRSTPDRGALSPVPAVLGGVATALLVSAAWAPVVDIVPSRWIAAALAGAALVLLAAGWLVPADRRAVPVGVLLAAACAPGLAATDDILAAVAGRLQWLDHVWTVDGNPSARILLAGSGSDEVGLGGAAPPSTVVLLLAVGAAIGLAAALVPGLRRAEAAAVPVFVAAGLLAAPALHTSYAVALGADLALAGAALTGGALLVRGRRTLPGAAAAVSGAVVLVLALGWSLASDLATVVVLPVAAAALVAAVVAARGSAPLRTAGVAGSVWAGLLVVAEAGALMRYAGHDWSPAVSLMLGLLAAAALTASLVATRIGSDRFWDVVRRALAVVGVAAVLADSAAVTWWVGGNVTEGSGGLVAPVTEADCGLVVALVAAALLALSTVPLPPRLVTVGDVRVVTGLGAGVALIAAATDADRLWVALLAVGVGVAVLGLRVDHRWGWLAGVLLTGSTWVRLTLADVDAPEAYTVPPALALLAVGWLRRRHDPAYRSWNAYAPGLVLALVPSLLRAVTDAGELRPFLLGLAALVVLGVGVARRLQAPLVIGAVVLAVDAVVQLAPYLAAAYDAVPRWVVIGLVGLLLLGAGATFEQRMRDLKRVGRHVTSLG